MEDLKNSLPNKLTLLMIMVCVVFCFQLFNFFGGSSERVKIDYIKKEISGLKKDVDDIYKTEKALDKKIDTFNIRIKNIHKAIIINNTKIDNLKKYEKTQIDKFKSYNARMFEQFFTDRYTKKNTTPVNGGK
jgi:hypothetical protein